NLRLAQEALGAAPAASTERGWQLGAILGEMEAQLSGPQEIESLSPTLKRLTEKAAKAARHVGLAEEEDGTPDLIYWIEALRSVVAEHGRDRLPNADAPQALKDRLSALADAARKMALSMDFAF